MQNAASPNAFQLSVIIVVWLWTRVLEETEVIWVESCCFNLYVSENEPIAEITCSKIIHVWLLGLFLFFVFSPRAVSATIWRKVFKDDWGYLLEFRHPYKLLINSSRLCKFSAFLSYWFIYLINVIRQYPLSPGWQWRAGRKGQSSDRGMTDGCNSGDTVLLI